MGYLAILKDVLQYWKQILAALLIVFAYWFGAHNDSKSWEERIAKADEAYAQKLDDLQQKTNADADAITAKYTDYLRQKDQKIRDLQKEIDNVKFNNDSKCTILNGTVDAHDRMLSVPDKTGVQGATDSGSGSGFDGTTSTVTLSQILDRVGTNYDICQTEMKKLTTLQEVVRNFQKRQAELTK